jgi:spore coat protein D
MFNCHQPRPKVLQTQVCPTQHAVRQHDCNYVVPVVHPRHTTNVVNHQYDFYHSFPQTESRVDRITNRQFTAPSAPGQVMGAFQPGPGPGVPGQVMGAQSPGQVMGVHHPGQVMGAHHQPCSKPRRGLFGGF